MRKKFWLVQNSREQLKLLPEREENSRSLTQTTSSAEEWDNDIVDANEIYVNSGCIYYTSVHWTMDFMKRVACKTILVKMSCER